MLKKLILQLILLLAYLLPASYFAQDVLGIYYSMGEDNRTLYVYSDITNVRSGPGINYEIIDKLSLGEEITVSKGFKLWENKDIYTQNGLVAHWVPISYVKEGIKKQGYTWQGNLSFNQLRRGTTKFIYGINVLELKKEKDYTLGKYKVELKVLENDSLIAKKIFLTDTEQSGTIGNIFENLGLKEVKNIVRIAFFGEACGIPTNYYYFAWNGKELLDLPSRYTVSDAGVYYYSEEFIFPLEKGGKPNTIIKKSEQGEFDENDINYEHPKLTEKTEEYLWNGKTYKKIK